MCPRCLKKGSDVPESQEEYDMRVAHPRKWNPYDSLDEVRELAFWGCTQSEIAAEMGVSPATFHNRMKDTPELREAVEAGQLQGKVKFRRLLWHQAVKGAPSGAGKPLAILAGTYSMGEHQTSDTRMGVLEDEDDPVEDMMKRLDEIDARRKAIDTTAEEAED